MSSVSSGVAAAASQLQNQLATTATQSALATQQQSAASLIQILEESQARIEATNASPPPTLDGTGQTVDISA